jgi:predicted transposase YbfD/YdcC
MLPNPMAYFDGLKDPRRETKNKLHKLGDIVLIALCAVLSGIEDWVGMEEFAEEKEVWLRGFLELPNGIPSHDTLSDVLGRIDPKAFAEAFQRWVQAALPSLSGQQVCLDGKTLRGSRAGDKAVHLMSAFAAEARWVLAQQTVDAKTNEITAIPDLLSMLDIAGALVSIDAMGCQKHIARTVIDAKASYLLALKDNHRQLCEDITLWLDTETAKGRLPVAESVDKNHGRIEIRRYSLSRDLDWLEQKADWAGLQAVGRVESTRIVGGKTSVENRYYLCSFTELERFAEGVRRHWSIENQQHWVLDVQFGEDGNRTRKDHSAENLALIRRTALNLLRNNGPAKDSLKRRKLRACLNDSYRSKLLFGGSAT